MTKRMYDMKSFCTEHSVSRTYAYAEIARGRLKAIKLGARTLIRAEDAEAWLNSLPAIEGRAQAA